MLPSAIRTVVMCTARRHRRSLPSGALCAGLRWSSGDTAFAAAKQSTLPNKTSDGEFTSSEIHDCNRKCRGILHICEAEGKGRGLFASRRFAPNDLVMSARAIATSKVRCSHSVQTDWDRHAVMDLPAILINHSCDANVGIRDNECGAYDFLAIKEIQEGEELVWDYDASEWELSVPFKCACGSASCRGMLRGFRHDGDFIRDAYEPFYASYLKKNKQ